MSSRTTELDTFFPLPSAPPSSQCPVRLPGITRASSDAIIQVLKDNHVKWHAIFNEVGFHNHASHHLLAIYALGAGGPLIQAAYATHAAYLKPAFDAVEPINDGNFWQHLGKRDFYNSYLEYFRALLLNKPIEDVLEEYIFSPKANVQGPGVVEQPRMLSRFLATAVHPMIHVGCGLEFGILGLVVEGIAQTAVHPVQGDFLSPTSLFETDSLSSTFAHLSLAPSINEKKQTGVHAFTILARILADPKFSPASLGLPLPEGKSKFDHSQNVIGTKIAALAEEWASETLSDGTIPAFITKKIEELAWMNTLIYGVTGWGGRDRVPPKAFNADFFLMHMLTSSIFLPSLVAHLSPRSSIILLRAYISTSLTWWIAEGRGALPIREFWECTTAQPVSPSEARPTPAKDTLTPADAAPNPWLSIVQTTIVHPAEHLCKVQRALLHNATAYGMRAAGDFAGTELEGAEVLDGTLFIRVAGLTADRMGWMKEGQEPGDWDRVGFF